MNKNIVIAILLIILAAGIYYWYGHRQSPAMVQNDQASTQTGTVPTTQSSAGKHAVAWKFESVGEDKSTGSPMSKVTVTWDGVSHDGGTYQGSCAEIDGSNGTLSDGEVSG